MSDWFKSSALDVLAGDVGGMERKNELLHSDLLARHGDSPMAVGWSSAVSQRSRLDRVFKQFEYSPNLHPSVLDVGCGLGDLAPLFQGYNWRGSYLGIDVNCNAIRLANERRLMDVPAPQYVSFKCVGLLQFQTDLQFDLVVASGLFSLGANPDERAEVDYDWQKYVTDAIRKMRELARHAVIVNFLSAFAAEQQPGMAYVSPGFMLDMLTEAFGPRIVLNHDDRTNDFTVTMPLTPYPSYSAEVGA